MVHMIHHNKVAHTPFPEPNSLFPSSNSLDVKSYHAQNAYGFQILSTHEQQEYTNKVRQTSTVPLAVEEYQLWQVVRMKFI